MGNDPGDGRRSERMGEGRKKLAWIGIALRASIVPVHDESRRAALQVRMRKNRSAQDSAC